MSKAKPDPADVSVGKCDILATYTMAKARADRGEAD